MGLGHVPQEPLRAEGEGADLQGRQRRRAPAGRPVDLTADPAINRSRQARGRWGEEQAERWYRAQGYEVLDRNWRCADGELDLVVTAGRTVVFVEVKARASDAYGSASSAVGERKQRRLHVLAVRWFEAHPHRRGEARFDVVAITGTRVEVLVAAF